MIDDGECAALECELAAALADLTDVSLDDESAEFEPNAADITACEMISVAHRDLDDILHAVSQQQIEQEKQASGSAGGLSAWELLLQSVDQSDREFFGAMNAEIDDIRATILSSASDTDGQTEVVKREATVRGGDHQSELQSLVSTNTQSNEHDEASDGATSASEIFRLPAPVQAKSMVKSGGGISDASPITPAPSQHLPNHSQPCNPQEHGAEPPTPFSSGDNNSIVSEAIPTPETSLPYPSTSSVQASILTLSLTAPLSPYLGALENDTNSAQHTSTAWLRLAQQRWEKQQQEAAQWLSQLELDVEHLRDEQERRERDRSEAMERSLMDREERRARQHIERLRELRFREGMRIEDVISLTFNSHLRRELQREQASCCDMEKEDEASGATERWLKQQATERRLLQEKNLMRRLFNSVLISLVERHRVKQAEQQKRLELERKRQTRENSLMRSEEAQTRRWIAQTLAIALERERLSNRMAMSIEDELAHELERLERRNRAMELRSCREMREEDVCCARAWEFALEEATRRWREEKRRRLERIRAIERTEAIVRALQRRQHLRLVLKSWHHSVREAIEREKQANRIQRWWRQQQRSRSHPESAEVEEEDCKMTDAWGEAAADAAMVVQSAFRGFFVRRRFQAALDLAREVGDGDEDGGFDEVNLDDLIELPPELADGWEDPVLPRFSRRMPVVVMEPSSCEHDADVGDDDDDERDDESADECVASRTGMTSRNNNAEEDGATVAAPVVKEANLAASLWNKMMWTKQKQQRAVEERARQLDPTYRVQKLLHFKRSEKQPRRQGGSTPAATEPANANKVQPVPTIAWTTSSNPPKPKVKLPSLVERLRKKTAAERANG